MHTEDWYSSVDIIKMKIEPVFTQYRIHCPMENSFGSFCFLFSSGSIYSHHFKHHCWLFKCLTYNVGYFVALIMSVGQVHHPLHIHYKYLIVFMASWISFHKINPLPLESNIFQACCCPFGLGLLLAHNYMRYCW